MFAVLLSQRSNQKKEQNGRKERRRCYSTTFIIVDKDKLLYNKSQINQDIKVSDYRSILFFMVALEK